MLFQLTLVLLSFNSAWLVHGKKCSGINRLSKDHQLVAGEDHTGDYSSSETPSSSEVATTSEASSASVPVVTETDDPTEDASESEHSNGGNSTGDFYTSGSLDMFSKRLLLDFSDVKEGEDASAKLAEGDFSMTTYTIGDGSDGTIPRQHMEENVKLGDGVLLMTTQAYSGSGNVKASEITTDESFLYASARVVLKSTDVEGVCIGHFFYGGGSQKKRKH